MKRRIAGLIVVLLLLSTFSISKFSSKQGINDSTMHEADAPEMCLSRSELPHFNYSSTLMSKLSEYEELHKKCTNVQNSAECKYVVWIPYQGLGNKMLSLVSTFLYALVTNRVMLVDRGADHDLPQLFCEPFKGTSWFVPNELLPSGYVQSLDLGAPNRFGRLLQSGFWERFWRLDGCDHATRSLSSLPNSVYIHIAEDMTKLDKHFFCQSGQELLSNVPMMLLKSDLYFVPQLYLVPAFRRELEKMFPDMNTVFQYTARHLLHPSNNVWSRVTRFYDAYLASSNELVGFQLRLSGDTSPGMVDKYWDQALSCGLQQEILPKVRTTFDHRVSTKSANKTTLLVVSLLQDFYDRFKEFYLDQVPEDGRPVAVQFPSHEQIQKTGFIEHDQKALSEIYLLSMCDKLVITARSTFGYVASALRGVKPWIILGQYDKGSQQPSCFHLETQDPCMLRKPMLDCTCKKGDTKDQQDSPISPCQDFPIGIRLG